MLSAKNITKKFSGVTALDNVSLDLQAGKVLAIIGENGAGKSTLMKILSGVYTDYEGSLMLDNQIVKFKNTREAQDKGIAIIHQELNLIPELSVAENIFLGREITNAFGLLDKAKMRQHTEGLLQKLKLNMVHPDKGGIDPNTPVKNLKVGQQQLIEIAKALLLNAKIIIMDEPTSAITGAEVEVLFDIIKGLKQEGKAIAYISHKLDELFKIADTYTVLRDGKTIESGEIKNVSKDILVSKMVGRDLVISHKKSTPSVSEELLKVEKLNYKKGLDISFSLKKGEILGIFGIMGAGRTELFEALFGLSSPSVSGNILIENKKTTIKSPADAVKAGLALVSEDRKKDGIIPELSVKKNISLTTLFGLSKNGIFPILSGCTISNKKEKQLADKYINDLKIKTFSDTQLIKTLSGGNQQKAILGKWLATNPKILLLDEPTRGIDINAKSEIYKLIQELAASGLGIIMVSSELPEILAVSDRVLVLSEGKLTGDFTIDEATEEGLLKAAIA
jgi:ribose transport system ATP-binding protein